MFEVTPAKINSEKAFPKIRIVLDDDGVVSFSGFTQEEASERFRERGLVGFIQQPYRPRGLHPKMEDFMRGREMSSRSEFALERRDFDA